MKSYQDIISTCKELMNDYNFTRAKEWKSKDDKRVIIGFIPNYFPRELIHAANGLPIGIVGTSDASENQKTCNMLEGVIKLYKDGQIGSFDGLILPSLCLSIHEEADISTLEKEGIFVKFLDYPQNFRTVIGDILNKHRVQDVLDEIQKINNVTVTPERIDNSIKIYKKNLKLHESIYGTFKAFPWKISYEEIYCIVRAGLVIAVEEHTEILENIYEYLQQDPDLKVNKELDVISGAFC